MKRKRNQLDENGQNGNDDKKCRVYEEKAPILDDSFNVSMEIKKEEFVLTREIAQHEILSDISGKQWRIGVPIGKGSFGEIFLASDDISKPVNGKNSNFVIKIEPHSNGPLFVEIHCLLNVNKRHSDEESGEDSVMQLDNDVGIPKYIASGSHYFSDSRYRFLIMPRYKTDLHSIFKCGRLSQRHFLIVASQIIDVLQHLHGKHYVHSDIKAENIMIGLFSSESIEASKSLTNASNQKTTQMRESKSCMDLFTNGKRSLRPTKKVAYIIDENSRSSHSLESVRSDECDTETDDDFDFSPKKKKNQKLSKKKKNKKSSPIKQQSKNHEKTFHNENDNERVYIIDYGLATKYMNNVGESPAHKPFCCDERRAHDGTLEFTSRDAHFGAHSRRSDLECLGYNLIYWSQGFLPWKDEKLKEQPEIVHRLKEIFMTDVKEVLKLLYGKDVPKYLGDFMDYVGQLEFDEEPDYNFLKGLFEKEYMRLGFKKGDMKLNLKKMREECEKVDKNMTENELMLSKIADINTARKLGFLIATDSVDGTEIQTKSNEMIALNISCKASPKNLRSKEKSKNGKRPKRQAKVTEKEQIIEKMAQGKKISLGEIALIDPDQFARARADREYERSDEKSQNQTPQKYHGNPTYAILEVESRLKQRQSGSAAVSNVSSGDMEPIKGYTKQMMDILRKQQLLVEKQILTPQTKRKRDRSKQAPAPLKKQVLPKSEKPRKVKPARRSKPVAVRKKSKKEEVVVDEEVPVDEEYIENNNKPKPTTKRTKRGPKKQKAKAVVAPRIASDENVVEETEKPVKKKRGRPKVLKSIIETQDTEEDSVYYDIPGEGSNDAKEMSEDNLPQISQESVKNDYSSDEESNNSVDTENSEKKKKKRVRGRYYADDDYDVSSDEESNVSSISNASEILENKPRRRKTFNNAKTTRNKTKSRSTSVSAPDFIQDSEASECSEMSEEVSDFEIQSGDESDEVSLMEYDQSETEEEESMSESDADDDSNDSIDFKYSPITKTRQTRRNENVKTSKGRRINVINDSVRNFRLISTQG